MIKYEIYSELNDDHICEAVGCFAQATTKVDVKVGMKGTITLHLCVNCIGKFDQREKVLDQFDHSLTPTTVHRQYLFRE